MSESAPTASPHRDRATSVRRNGLSKVSAIATTPGDMPSPRHPLAARASFWITAAIAFLAFAANAAASPLYRVYQAQLHFSATTLTLLFTVYVAVLLITLL